MRYLINITIGLLAYLVIGALALSVTLLFIFINDNNLWLFVGTIIVGIVGAFIFIPHLNRFGATILDEFKE